MSDQGSVFAAFIEEELKAEYERRAAHEARGVSILTTSTGFAGLIFALAALATGSDYEFSGAALPLILLTALLFVLAGLSGLAANLLRGYEVVDPAQIDTMLLRPGWEVSEVAARNRVLWIRRDTLESLRGVNDRKAKRVGWGQWFQIAAVAVLFLTVVLELIFQ